jgi:hypothetical protein
VGVVYEKYISLKSTSVRYKFNTLNYIMHSATLHIHTFLNIRQHVAMAGCLTSFVGLIGWFVFDILLLLVGASRFVVSELHQAAPSR